jgi:hypothetical protein
MALILTETAAPTPAAAPAAAPVAAEAPTQKAAPRARNAEVRGQVRMHAIKSGYDVAALLAATIATGPEGVKAELHRLAKEVAAEIEAYTFAE